MLGMEECHAHDILRELHLPGWGFKDQLEEWATRGDLGAYVRIDVREVAVTPSHEDWFFEVACEAIRAIRAAAFHPVPSWACSSCEYHRACRGT